MKNITFIALLGASLLCSHTNARAQILKNISKKIEKKAEEMIDRSFNSDSDAPPTETPKTEQRAEGPFKNIPDMVYDFKAGDEIIFFDDFSGETPGTMASRWTSNGTGTTAQVDGFEGQWLRLFNENTYKIKELVQIPENFTLEFDLLTLADSKNGIAINIGFDHQKGIGRHYYLAYQNPVNIEASFNFDRFNFDSNEVYPTKKSEIEADMSYFVNDVMKVKVLVQGDRMSVYIDQFKVLDTEMVDPMTKKYFYVAVENEANRGEIYLGNVKLAEL